MSIHAIRLWPDPLLLRKSEPVDPAKYAAGEYDQLIGDMWDTLYDVGGVGLAAVQIGVLLRICVMDVREQHVFVNPVIDNLEGDPEIKNEGCLSLPGVIEYVPRYGALTVSSLQKKSPTPATRRFTGMEAQCVQHEVDHFDGITLPDKLNMTSEERLRVLAQMKKGRPKPRDPKIHEVKE